MSGEVLVAFSAYLGHKSNNYAESYALLLGLQICYQMDIFQIEVETDSKLIIQWLNVQEQVPWSLVSIWKDIQMLTDQLDVNLHHLYRVTLLLLSWYSCCVAERRLL